MYRCSLKHGELHANPEAWEVHHKVSHLLDTFVVQFLYKIDIRYTDKKHPEVAKNPGSLRTKGRSHGEMFTAL